jgi:hypothetical protein
MNFDAVNLELASASFLRSVEVGFQALIPACVVVGNERDSEDHSRLLTRLELDCA